MTQRVRKFGGTLVIVIVILLLLTSPSNTAICSHFVDNNVGQDGDGSKDHPWNNIAGHVDDLTAGDVMCVRGNASAPARIYTEAMIDPTVSGAAGSHITVRPFMDGLVTIQPTGEKILRLYEVDYWQFLDFAFDMQSTWDASPGLQVVHIRDADYNIIRRCKTYNGMTGIHITSGDYNLIDDCQIYDNGIGMFLNGGTGNIVRACTIANNRGDGIHCYKGTYTLLDAIIEDCHIYTTLGKCSENAVDVKQGNVTIRGNVMHGFRYCDASCGGTGGGIGAAIVIHMEAHDITIEGNEIYDCASGITLVDTENARIVNNVIHDLAIDDEAWANIAILTHFSTNVDIINNTFANIPRHVLWISLRNNFDIRNNLFHDTGWIVLEDIAALTADYNGWFSAAERIEGPHDTVGDDPAFASPSDYHLRATSPARDAGTDVGVVTDFEGDPRPFGSGFDIGADEYVSTFVYLPIVFR